MLTFLSSYLANFPWKMKLSTVSVLIIHGHSWFAYSNRIVECRNNCFLMVGCRRIKNKRARLAKSSSLCTNLCWSAPSNKVGRFAELAKINYLYIIIIIIIIILPLLSPHDQATQQPSCNFTYILMFLDFLSLYQKIIWCVKSAMKPLKDPYICLDLNFPDL